jgi:hypothetical protein
MGKKKVKRNRFRTSGANALKEPVAIQAAIPTTIQSENTTSVDPQEEYIAAYGRSYAALNQVVPSQAYDPKAPEISFDTYRQMLNDPEVLSDIRTLRDMVLADGVQLTPAVAGKAADEDTEGFARSQEITEFCERNLMGLRKPFKTTLEGVLEGALVYGHKVAEITWKMGTGIDRNRLVLDKLSQKDYRTLDFVVDQFWNHLGFTPRQSARVQGQVIPREKFAMLTLHEEDEDPRGRSSIRSVYTAWTFKGLCWPEYKRWLDNCALPSIVGKTAPKQPGDVQRNADGTKKDGGKMLSAPEAMMNALLGLKNASVAVVPNGAEVDQLQVVGEGAGFERAINVADSQIGKGILFQTLATSEAQFGTRAQSQTHLQVLDMLVWWLKGKVADMIANDLIKAMIRYNYGDEALEFAPIVSLGDTERRDWATDASSASLLEPAITDSQWNHLTTQLGIPAPLPGEKPRREARSPELQPVQTFAPDDDEDARMRLRYRPRSGPFITLRRVT